MPVYDDNFGGRVVHLGHGDVVIALSHTASVELAMNELAFVPHEPRPIGEHISLEGETSETTSIPVRFVFDNIESLDVLIERAESLREAMHSIQLVKNVTA